MRSSSGRRIAASRCASSSLASQNENAYIERFNRTYRDEVLSAYPFESTEQVQQITDDWLIEYNELRPHDSLWRVPPLTYMPRELPAGESSFKLST